MIVYCLSYHMSTNLPQKRQTLFQVLRSQTLIVLQTQIPRQKVTLKPMKKKASFQNLTKTTVLQGIILGGIDKRDSYRELSLGEPLGHNLLFLLMYLHFLVLLGGEMLDSYPSIFHFYYSCHYFCCYSLAILIENRTQVSFLIPESTLQGKISVRLSLPLTHDLTRS